MGAAVVKYERVGRSSCENCGGPFTWLNASVRCPRCAACLCRACFSSRCTIRTGRTVIALPVLIRRYGVCDSCWPEADREEEFKDKHLPMLVRGELVTLIKSTLIAESTTQVWLTLLPTTKVFHYQSLQLVNQQPKEAADVKIDDIAGIQSGTTAAAGAGLAAANGSTAAYNSRFVIRLVSARSHTVLTFACTDERQFKRWSVAVSETISCASMRNSSIFTRTTASGDINAAAAAGNGAASKPADNRHADLVKRQAEREAFRAQLGNVGMANTARILLERQAREREEQGESKADVSIQRTLSQSSGGASSTTQVTQVTIELGARTSASSSSPSANAAARPPLHPGPGINPASLNKGNASTDGQQRLSGAAASFRALGVSGSRAFDSLVAAVRQPPPPGGAVDGASSAVSTGGRPPTAASSGPAASSRRGSGMISMPVAEASAALSSIGTGLGRGFSAMRTGLGSVARTVAARVDNALPNR